MKRASKPSFLFIEDYFRKGLTPGELNFVMGYTGDTPKSSLRQKFLLDKYEKERIEMESKTNEKDLWTEDGHIYMSQDRFDQMLKTENTYNCPFRIFKPKESSKKIGPFWISRMNSADSQSVRPSEVRFIRDKDGKVTFTYKDWTYSLAWTNIFGSPYRAKQMDPKYKIKYFSNEDIELKEDKVYLNSSYARSAIRKFFNVFYGVRNIYNEKEKKHYSTRDLYLKIEEATGEVILRHRTSSERFSLADFDILPKRFRNSYKVEDKMKKDVWRDELGNIGFSDQKLKELEEIFNEGVEFTIYKPKNQDEGPKWLERMDKYDGQVINTKNFSIRDIGNNYCDIIYEGYAFSFAWTDLVDEKFRSEPFKQVEDSNGWGPAIAALFIAGGAAAIKAKNNEVQKYTKQESKIH